MTCSEVRLLISPYLDGVVPSRQMGQMSDHIQDCGACAREYSMLRMTQNAVAGLGREQLPPELSLRLRVMVSQQAAMRRRSAWATLQLRIENVLQAFMVPATAGALSAIVMFGLLIGMFAIPAPLRASSYDVPTKLYTPPQLVLSPFAGSFSADSDDAVVVEALVDESGRIQDYRIISAPPNFVPGKMISRLENMLIFTVFQPARAFGRPTSGRAIISFSRISVRG
jgi:Putative zinc-finger